MKRAFKNTWAGKAVAWLETQPVGLQVATVDLALALGFQGPLESFSSCLRKCNCTGLRKVTSPRRGMPTYWSLAKHEPAVDIEIEDDGIEWLPRRSSFPEIQPRPGPWFPGGVTP